MSLDETWKIIEILQLQYPDNFKDKDDEKVKGVVKLWHTILADYTYHDVQVAVLAHIANDTKGFMPPVGAINQRIMSMQKNDISMPEMTAWGLVYNAITRSTYNSAEEFDKLPEICKKVVGSPEILRQWAMTEGLNIEVVQSNFMRSYRAVQKSETELAAVPRNIRNMISQIGNEQKMIGGNG